MAGAKAIHLCAAAIIAAMTGCSWSHQFQLEDLEQVTPGVSTLEDVGNMLHFREPSLLGQYYSSEQEVLPPSPLSFLSWPLMVTRHSSTYFVRMKADEQGVVRTGTLEITEESEIHVLLLFGPADYKVHLTEKHLHVLRNLQDRGIEVFVGSTPVRCFGGIIGWETVSLDEYLRADP